MKNSQTNFVQIIREICSESGISLNSYSSDWIFRLEKGGRHGIIMGYQFGLNNASVNMLCCDKCAASELMTERGIPNIEHFLFASPDNQKFMGYPGNWRELLRLLDKYGTVVCKPNQGTGGENVFKCSSDFELEEAVHCIFMRSDYMAVSRFYEIENEYRAVILDGQIRLLYRKKRPQIIGDGIHTVAELLLIEASESGGISLAEQGNIYSSRPAKGERVILNWRHNLGQGSRADIQVEAILKEEIAGIVRRVYEEIGVRFASVDIAETAEGLKVMEINSGVMMENFAGQDEASYNTAKQIYRDAIWSMLSRST